MSRIAFGSILGMALIAGGCAKKADDGGTSSAAASSATPAGNDTLGTAEIKDAKGKTLGLLKLGQGKGGIFVAGAITGLAPGEYGMHIHEVGLCEAPDFKTAGGHWNPTGKQHGKDNPAGPHYGDLANLVITPDSGGMVHSMTMGGMFNGDSTALMDKDGASVVIHAGPDDYKTDPSGNSGARIACGVIVRK